MGRGQSVLGTRVGLAAHRRHRDRQRGGRRRRARPRGLGAPHRTDGRPGRRTGGEHRARRRLHRRRGADRGAVGIAPVPPQAGRRRCAGAARARGRAVRADPGGHRAGHALGRRRSVVHGAQPAVRPAARAQVGETILLGGIANCALVYLLTERILRETTARALRDTPSARRMLPGILTRSIVFWALGTGVPIVGLMLAGVDQLTYRDISGVQLGLIMVTARRHRAGVRLPRHRRAARAVADPVMAVRQGCAGSRRATSARTSPSTTAPSWDGCRPGSTAWSSGCASGSGCATSSAAKWAATSPRSPSPPTRCG